MEAFLARVVVAAIKILLVGKADATNEEARRAIQDMIVEATRGATADIWGKLDSIQKTAIDRVDAMDGKMGNLTEQISFLPNQVIKGILDGIVKATNPFGR